MVEFENLIANVGFPIAVSCWLLLRMEMKMDKLTAAISALAVKVEGKGGV